MTARDRVVAAAILLVAALAPASAQNGCWAVTGGAAKVFRDGLTPAQYRASLAEAQRRRCSTAPVAEGTVGAIAADQARELLPLVRQHFAGATESARPKARSPQRRARAPRRGAAAPVRAPGAPAPPPAAPIHVAPVPAEFPPPVEPVTTLPPELLAPP